MSIPRPSNPLYLLVAAILAAGVCPMAATAQSEAVSRQSEASLAASAQVPLVALEALSEGVAFAVTAVEFSGELALVTVSAAAEGSAIVIELSARLVRDLGLAVGVGVTASAVATGWILSTAGEALLYVADQSVQPLIHSRRISG